MGHHAADFKLPRRRLELGLLALKVRSVVRNVLVDLGSMLSVKCKSTPDGVCFEGRKLVVYLLHGKPVFALPGSERAVRTALEKLILPAAIHLVEELER